MTVSRCRTWLFVAGADERAHAAAARSGADVIILELEDFTPPELRAKARALAGDAFSQWKRAGAKVAVRVNPLATDGREDLKGVLPAHPDFVLMSKVACPDHVRELEAATGAAFDLVPNIETAAGLVRTLEIVRASPRVVAALLGSEELVAGVGSGRRPCRGK